MKRYQAQLLNATAYKPLHPRAERELVDNMKRNIHGVLSQGFWYCNTCEARCERIEDDHGQPAHCEKCGSHRIQFVPPIGSALEEVA